jgi:EAL domain-containing protein (putative c-di-GMP-specific phosphodiesterase class I)/GGDEF domain-containing protein
MTIAVKPRSGTESLKNTAAEQSRYKLARLLAFAFCAADALVETKPNGEVVYSSGAMHHIFGRSQESLKGELFDSLPAKEDRAVLGALLGQVAKGDRFQDVPIKVSRPDLGDIVVSLSGYQVPDLSNHCFFTARAVEAGRDVANGGERDSATGLLTADGFGDSVTAHVNNAAAGGDKGELTFLGLTGMSELAGRLDGDEHQSLLRRLGILLKAASLGGDMAAQLGDDRFGFLHNPDLDIAGLEGQISEFARDADPKGVGVSVTANSVGVEAMDFNGQDVAQALVYTIQQVSCAGGNISNVLSENIGEQIGETVGKIARIKSIIDAADFDIAFQAIVSLKSRKPHHFEALLRLDNSPVKMNPFQFVCFAEDTGLISDLDIAVCRKVISRIISASERGSVIPVAVNISGHSIGSTEFVKELRKLLAENPEVHGSILFEITETARISDLEKANNTIRALRADGFHVCLDDFGSGEAAFEYLRELDVDFVKIDGKYVKDAATSDKDKAFLVAMSGLCRDLGIATIAEFIEDETTLEFLKECGVAYGQGYLFHKPDVGADLAGNINPAKNMKRKGAKESWG